MDKAELGSKLEVRRADLYKIAYLITRNRAEAEDIVQETFYRALRSAESFDGANLGAWLGTILRNEARSRYSRNSYKKALLASYALAIKNVALPNQDTRLALSEAWARANPALRLSALGYSLEEISRLTGKSPGGVKVSVNYFRSKLRQDGT